MIYLIEFAILFAAIPVLGYLVGKCVYWMATAVHDRVLHGKKDGNATGSNLFASTISVMTWTLLLAFLRGIVLPLLSGPFPFETYIDAATLLLFLVGLVSDPIIRRWVLKNTTPNQWGHRELPLLIKEFTV